MKNMALFNMFNTDDETEKLANTLSWLDDEKEEEDKDSAKDKDKKDDTDESEDEGSIIPWIALGVGVVLVLGGAGWYFLVFKKNRK